MKEKLRKTIRIVLVVILIISIGMLAIQVIQGNRGRKVYESAQKLAIEPMLQETEMETEIETEEKIEQTESAAEETETETAEKVTVKIWQEVPVEDDPNMEEIERVDLDVLREVNEDVLGWIEIPDTVISYPIMQGEDNDYYLNHTWEGESSKVGSIFLEALSSADFTDHNTVIYGHKRGNEGTMFGPLHYFAEQDFVEEHPYVYIKNDAGVHRYEIFSVHEAPVGSMTYQIGFASDESRQRFLDYCMEKSVVDTGVTATLDDRIITMSTCTGDGFESRWIVQARLEGMWVEVDQSLNTSETNGRIAN